MKLNLKDILPKYTRTDANGEAAKHISILIGRYSLLDNIREKGNRRTGLPVLHVMFGSIWHRPPFR